MIRSVRVALAGVILLSTALVIGAGDAHANPNVYRRWADGKSWSCTDTGSGVDVVLGDQNVEFSGLPASATFTINYIDNGVNTPAGPFPVEQTSGTHSYGSFSEHFASYPLTFDFRLDTIVSGIVVYQSTIHVACSADSSGTVDAANSDVSAPGFRRWTDGKTYSCIPNGAGVAVTLSNQDIEVYNLPTGAQFMLHYIDNGVDTPSGPFPVEAPGIHNYGSFLEAFPSYPFTFDFRIDTIIDGTVVYQSNLHIECTGDTSGSVSADDTGSAPPGFRRWTDGKTYSCIPNGAGVAVTLSNQDIEVYNLPTGAQFMLHYIDNGVDTPSGPFPVEAPGIHNYGSFLEAFPAYPFTFDFRIDTIIDGTVVYQSNLHMECTSDAAGVTPVEDSGAAPPSTTSTTTTTNGSSTTTTRAGGGQIPVTGSRTGGSTLAALLLLMVGATAAAAARRRST